MPGIKCAVSSPIFLAKWAMGSLLMHRMLIMYGLCINVSCFLCLLKTMGAMTTLFTYHVYGDCQQLWTILEKELFMAEKYDYKLTSIQFHSFENSLNVYFLVILKSHREEACYVCSTSTTLVSLLWAKMG
jgi:hypothetical protein